MSRVHKSADKSLVRRLNTALILSHLRTSKCKTRAILAASTGLTRATVSSLVDELIALNLVRETGLQPSQGGRPGTALELNPAGGSAIGIEIGVGFVEVVLADFVANVLWRERIVVNTKDFQAVNAVAERLIADAEAQSQAHGLNLLGIGVSLPGLVNSKAGLLKFAPNLGWHDIPLQALWQARFRVPIYVMNDANAAALGEYYFGIATDYHDFIYLRLNAVGLGAGIMLGETLFQGLNGYAGEVGHMVLDPAGPACACGRYGCWERFAGLESLHRLIAQTAGRIGGSQALEAVYGDVTRLTPDQIAAAAGDPVIADALTRYSQTMVIGLVNLINTFNPQLIVVGGALRAVVTPFLPMIESLINEQVLRAFVDKAEIKVSDQDDVCLMGTVAAVLEVIFANPAQSLEYARP